MNLKINRLLLLTRLSYIAMIISSLFFNSIVTVSIMIFLLFVILFSYIKASENKDGKTIAYIISLPLMISSIQNLYLGFGVNNFTSMHFYIMLTLNIDIFVIIYIYNLLKSIKNKNKNVMRLNICILVILVASLLLILIYPTSMSAYFSSFRNIIGPFVILLSSFYSGDKIDVDYLFKRILFIISIVVVTGFIEYFIGNEFWINLNVKQLWNIKGLNIGNRILPGNFYSSELINGHQIRRMVASYADPVNLGTFLFAAFMVTWYKKKYFLSVLVVICCALTISKGALLGFLVFILIYSTIFSKSKMFKTISTLSAFFIGIGFVIYSQLHSTGSLNAHVNGFVNSLMIPFKYPLGLGLGNVGVLANKLGSSIASDIMVTESGIGMVISQLGFIGIITYYVLFNILIKQGKSISGLREKCMIYVLTISFLLNAFFNEVALSPNSCTLYFIIIGLLIAINSKENNYENTNG